MARPRAIDLKPAEAMFVLEELYRDGVVSSDVMSEYRGRYETEIQTLEARLNYLKTLGSEAAAAVIGVAAAAAVPQVVRRVRKARASKAAARRKGGAGRQGRAASKGKSKTRSARPASAGSSDRELIRKTQGRYLALLRKVPAGVKKRFGREAIEKKGKDAVVAEMETYVATLAPKAEKGRRSKK